MQQTDSFRNRKQKLNYLKGIIEDTTRIEEIGERKAYLFILTSEPGIFYMAKSLEQWKEPVVKNGVAKKYTQEDINALKKRPNTVCLEMKFTTPHPFPTIEENVIGS